jgi:hypothetical protein
MHADSVGFFAENVSADVPPLFQNKTFFSRTTGTISKNRAVKSGTHNQVIVMHDFFRR